MAEEHGGGGGGIRELLAIFSIGVDDHELKKGESSVLKFVDTIKTAAGAFAEAFVAHEVFEFVEGQVHAMHAVERTAVALGISTEKVQAFQFAARALGEDGAMLTNLLGKMQVAQSHAADGSGKGAAAFTKLGISVKDAHGKTKPADELFSDVAEHLSKIDDPAKQAAIATELFGKSGRQLLPILKEGKDGIGELLKEYEELGGGFTEDSIEQAKKFEKEQAKLNLVWQKTKELIARALLPLLIQLLTWLKDAVKWFDDAAKKSNIFEAALIAMGAAAVAFGANMLIAMSPIIAMVGALALFVLIVDDIMTMFKGGDSLAGRWIDKIFGKDAHVDVVRELKSAWDGLKDTFATIWKFVKQIWDFFKWTLDNLSAIGEALGTVTESLAHAGQRAPTGGPDALAQMPWYKNSIGKWASQFNDTKAVGGSQFVPFEASRELTKSSGSSGSQVTNSGSVHAEFNVTVDPTGLNNKIEKVAQRHGKKERSTANARLQRAPAQ